MSAIDSYGAPIAPPITVAEIIDARDREIDGEVLPEPSDGFQSIRAQWKPMNMILSGK